MPTRPRFLSLWRDVCSAELSESLIGEATDNARPMCLVDPVRVGRFSFCSFAGRWFA